MTSGAVPPAGEDRRHGDRYRAGQHRGTDSGSGGEDSARDRAERFGALRNGAEHAVHPAEQRVRHLALQHADHRHAAQGERRAAEHQEHRRDGHIASQAEARLGGSYYESGGLR